MEFRVPRPGRGLTRGLITAAGVLLLVVAVALAPIAALAAPAAQAAPTQEAPRAKSAHPFLERLYQRELTVLEREQERLERAGEFVGRLETYIHNQKEKSKDTSSLEVALAKYNEAVATAKSYRDTAQSVLGAHAGFDENGKVTDAAQARQTLLTAGKAERDFHRTLLQGLWQLRDVIAEYRLG